MRNLNLSVAVLIGALALTGCGRNPVAPHAVVPTDPAATLGRGFQTDEPTPPPVQGEAGADGSLYVEAGGAGVLTVGRWTLTIHKNSHLDAATVSMTVRDPQSMEVEIQVIPASANVFQVPIELVADMSDQPNMVLDDNTIFWWNETWVEAEIDKAQAGNMLLKAKATELHNAMVSSKVTIHNGNKKN